MRIFTSFFYVLLVVGGVLGVEEKKVTVMKGDTVTLNPDDAEIKTGDLILWKFKGSIIGRRKTDGSISTYDGAGGIFKEKLLLDKLTGSLTITDLTTDHTGLYQLEIRSTTETQKNYSVTVSDVVESVSVMEGDSLTLHTGVKLQGDDKIVWKFGDEGIIIITNLNGGGWRNTHQSEQTRDLTISNIRRNQSGAYKMEINTSSMILHKKFSINIIDEMKTVSVKEGEPVTLDTGLIKIKGYDLILWTFENHLIARINRATNQFSIFSAGGKFEGRLQRDLQTESLIISDSRTTDSGDYHLNMSNSTHTLQRTIRVTVTEGSDWKTVVIVVGVVSLVIIGFLIMISYKKRICWKKGGAIPNPSSTELLPKGTDEGLIDLNQPLK